MAGGVLLRARSFDWRARAVLRPGAVFRVHSVFERALNLRLADDLLLGLVGPGGGNGPATLVLSGLPPGGLPALVAAGQHTRVAPPSRLALGPGLAVEFGAAALWQPPAPRLPLAPALARTSVRRAAELAWQARGRDGLGGLLPHLGALSDPLTELPLLPTPLLQHAGQAARALCAAWRSGDRTAAGLAAGRLIGLGPGQTPAGDDLLAGFFVARLRGRPGERQQTALVAACLEDAAGRTTDLALARLRFAAQGELDERSLEALAALADGAPERLESAVRALLGFGHSSGLDTLVGLLLGLSLESGTDRRQQTAAG